MGVLKSIKPAFWLANGMEAGERLAYFGIRAVLPLMMVSVGAGGLGLSMSQKGIIYCVWALIQCLVPMVSGGFSESFGYKKSIIVAFIINMFGYLMMANILNISELLTGSTDLNQTANFWLMLISGCTIGMGTAIFKPPVGGVVAKSLDEKSSGLGFGIFYWVVNIGGFLAPLAASALRGTNEAPTWHYVFYGAAIVTLINLLFTIVLFKEPDRNAEPVNNSAFEVFRKTLGVLWYDKLMLLFLIIVSGFWLMFMQLWDLLPNFLDEWVDRRGVGQWLSQFGIFNSFLESNGALKPEMIINIDSAAIICFVLPLSALFARFRMMTALSIGMAISVVGFIMSGMTMRGEIACLAVFIFAIGEIICSPKFDEYVGMTAPTDKKAIYMGFVNIPFAIGWALGDLISGPLYDGLSSKPNLAVRYLIEHGTDPNTLQNLSQDQLMAQIQSMNGLADSYEATRLLWDTYSPQNIWLILGAIGLASMAGLIVFYFKSGMAQKDKENAEKARQEAEEAKHKSENPDALEANDTNL